MRIKFLGAYLTCIASIALIAPLSTLAGETSLTLESEFARVLNPLTTKRLVPGYYFAIYKNGKKVFERAEGQADEQEKLPPGENTLYAVASMTKPLTALALLRLSETSDLRLDDPVSKYIPGFEDVLVAPGGSYDSQMVAASRQITLFDLLTHTSGLTYSSGITGVGEIAEAYKKLGILTIESNAVSRWGKLENHIERLIELPLVNQPGERFTYSVGYDVASRIIEVASGTSFDAYLTKEVLLPLGMVDTFFKVPEEKQDRLARLYSPLKRTYQIPSTPKMYQEARILPKGVKNFGVQSELVGGGNGLISSPLDYSRFLNFLLKRSEKNPLALTQKSFDLLLNDQLGETLGKDLMIETMGKAASNTVFSLALGIVLEKGAVTIAPENYDYLTWGGAFSTQFWLDPKTGVSGIFMTQMFPVRARLTAELEDIADKFLTD
jgi:CubicO group peptidase (beta-lactamase class C family)